MNFQEQFTQLEEDINKDEVRRLKHHTLCSLLGIPIAGGVGYVGIVQNNAPLMVGGYASGIALGIYVSYLFSKVSETPIRR